jgi:hypothetical protein
MDTEGKKKILKLIKILDEIKEIVLKLQKEWPEHLKKMREAEKKRPPRNIEADAW